MQPRKATVLKEAPVITVPPQPPAYVQTVDKSDLGSFSKHYFSKIPSFHNDLLFLTTAEEYIKQNEGYKNKLYKDTKGNWTIGIGHLVAPNEVKDYQGRILNAGEISRIFQQDIKAKMGLVRQQFGSSFDMFSNHLKAAILDGYFRGDLERSPKTRELLMQGRFKEAAHEYLHNAEYQQAKLAGSGVAKRMERNAATMRDEAT